MKFTGWNVYINFSNNSQTKHLISKKQKQQNNNSKTNKQLQTTHTLFTKYRPPSNGSESHKQLISIFIRVRPDLLHYDY